MDPLVLTAELDAAAFAHFDELRQRHFPTERNLVPAHITLFHKLPGEERSRIEYDLKRHLPSGQVDASVTGLRSLGRGVTYTLESAALTAIQKALALAWKAWLTPQDRQPFQPHIVIQNKATSTAARVLLGQLRDRFDPLTFPLTAFLLWHYRGGPWDLAARFPFEDSGSSSSPHIRMPE